MRRRRALDPYLITARYPGKCPCGQAIKAGDQVMYYPASRKVECRTCATRTLEALADERMAG
jgi:hypothetical protein